MSFLCWDPRAGCRVPAGVSPEQSRGAESPPSPAAHAALDAAQDTFGFLGWECPWLGHVQPLTHQHPQVLLPRPALHLFIPQPVLISEVALTQVQQLALRLVKPHEIPMGPLLDLVPVPLEGIPAFRYVSQTNQLGVICGPAEDAFDPFIDVINEDIK
ncbi:hypothetical protein HGM15179_016205 [Zosterops borbonicus]|uniref:Uncharacterized protein n=1 Tax=Zosterops borbonicus TaxID=364589 RepID=A0A8K1G387_9PASS|nr:hypothetical protein HGM15179_016205 [Zosterops borbonicus]